MALVHKPPPPLPSFAGVSDMKALITLIEHKSEAKKFFTDYSKLIDRHETVIEAYGALNEIERLKEETANFQEQAGRELAEAKAVLDKAKETAKVLVRQAEDKVAELEAQFAKSVTAFDNARRIKEAEHHTAMTDLAKREKALAKMENDARILLENAEKQEAQINEQLEKFRQAGLL